eukprot:1160749-Pelagomonas_calceolata.AAC.1
MPPGKFLTRMFIQAAWAQGRVQKKGHGLANRLHAQIWLLKTYAIPAGMYASQILATPYLRQGKGMDNPIKKVAASSA